MNRKRTKKLILVILAISSSYGLSSFASLPKKHEYLGEFKKPCLFALGSVACDANAKKDLLMSSDIIKNKNKSGASSAQGR